MARASALLRRLLRGLPGGAGSDGLFFSFLCVSLAVHAVPVALEVFLGASPPATGTETVSAGNLFILEVATTELSTSQPREAEEPRVERQLVQEVKDSTVPAVLTRLAGPPDLAAESSFPEAALPAAPPAVPTTSESIAPTPAEAAPLFPEVPLEVAAPVLHGSEGASGSFSGAQPDAPRNRRPEYPHLAERRRWEGTVLLEVKVSAGGRAESVEVESSSGHACLDEAARVAVRDWAFRPASQGGGPVPCTVHLPVRFALP